MGWFSKAIKTVSRPDKILKDPKKATQFALDPAGSTVRAGRGDMPNNLRSTLDPGGFFDGRQGTSYQPYQTKPMQLSPAAQTLYDNMKARMVERDAAKAAGQQPTWNGQPAAQSTPGMVSPVAAPGVVQAPPKLGRVLLRPPGKADGGQVRAQLSGVEHFESKAFERKKNGKPS